MMLEEEFEFECVRPIESHARLIMQWRNDPMTLAMSYHSEPKQWDSFFSEFLKDYFCFPDLPPLFVLHHMQPIAFLRFKPVKHPLGYYRKCCDISINLAPEHRGQNFGSRILDLIKKWVAQQGYDDLYAEVKQENLVSQKAFTKAGYEQLRSKKKVFPVTGEVFSIERFLASLSSKNKIPKSVFIIAEVGSNWKAGTEKEDFNRAKEMIQVASEAGCDAIKFQVFRPETLYVPNAGSSDYLSEAGICEDISSLLAQLVMPYDMISELACFCREHGVQFMASTFSKEDLKAVDPFVAIHKIASYEITHIRLIEEVAKTKKPIFLSTGAALEEEIAYALKVIESHGGGEVTLLQCTACYPAKPESMHLRTIPWLANRFKRTVGLSDHSQDLTTPIAAVALGAKVIEKHFTLNKAFKGPDHSFAIDPPELRQMVISIRQTEKMLGSDVKIIDESESELRTYAQRGIQAITEIPEGTILREGVNIDILRPGKQSKGIHPDFLSKMEGHKAKRHIPLGSGIQQEDW